MKGAGSRRNSGGSGCVESHSHWETRHFRNHATSHADLLGRSLEVIYQIARSSGGQRPSASRMHAHQYGFGDCPVRVGTMVEMCSSESGAAAWGWWDGDERDRSDRCAGSHWGERYSRCQWSFLLCLTGDHAASAITAEEVAVMVEEHNAPRSAHHSVLAVMK